ncbi:hypothetical protein SEA_SAVAGE2526_10 [Arthrobacter phage Savage2526]|uniref:Uncharacterized protein n=12 Tax=Korravirus TaxID=1982076 RepID=A0A3S9U9Q1_9CAUD|nr:hypothetical protein IMMACULATA_10 [Arthrobacter phage Immaculata]ALY10029.1 hypothetical protein RAP15_10 [Arthrobacter phage RAP15]AOT24100.1 hypothetical protein SEA_VALLEJO_10 [Arthrobacter phage Vallejo]ATW58884.1 hypothetical protein PHIRE_FLUKE_10 [Arthrobacter phage Fluke]ATW58946.1 hypothetical protein PHIRE_MEGANNOLL_10 [Arthrobacter phage MeganNoll]AZF98474.1 hypothetical protein SEA_BEETHOVEN_10 [Arthrobacter phage Beethoven]AZS07054.1 hypothetical protein SEA_CHOLULA_10 [Arthr
MAGKLHTYEVRINGIKHRIQATEEYAASLGEGNAKLLSAKEAEKPLEIENKSGEAPANK